MDRRSLDHDDLTKLQKHAWQCMSERSADVEPMSKWPKNEGKEQDDEGNERVKESLHKAQSSLTWRYDKVMDAERHKPIETSHDGGKGFRVFINPAARAARADRAQRQILSPSGMRIVSLVCLTHVKLMLCITATPPTSSAMQFAVSTGKIEVSSTAIVSLNSTQYTTTSGQSVGQPKDVLGPNGGDGVRQADEVQCGKRRVTWEPNRKDWRWRYGTGKDVVKFERKGWTHEKLCRMISHMMLQL